MITLTINGVVVDVAENTTIMDAAKSIGVEIPALCYLKEVKRSAPAGSAWWRQKVWKSFSPPATPWQRKAW